MGHGPGLFSGEHVTGLGACTFVFPEQVANNGKSGAGQPTLKLSMVRDYF